MNKKQVIILYGGAEEAKISKVSASYILEQIDTLIDKTKSIRAVTLDINNFGNLSELMTHLLTNYDPRRTFVIPCIHGHPGESGLLPSLLSEANFDYLGCNQTSSSICFNKITTKLWCEKLGIPVTPFMVISKTNHEHRKKDVLDFFNKNGNKVFVKTPAQGSSIGCYNVTDASELDSAIIDSFKYGQTTLIEKSMNAREIEIAAFTIKNQLILSEPGEVITNGEFYDFEKKYSKSSSIKTKTNTDLEPFLKEKIKHFCPQIFQELGLRHLARIDFFVEEKNNLIYLNEINTFPGMTPISMFPKMMEDVGVSFASFLADKLKLGEVE